MPPPEPPCPLCGGVLVRDNCGPIEGGPVWIRKGETAPSPEVEGAEGTTLWVCGRCLAKAPGADGGVELLPDPERAAEILARLVSAEDWAALARLHDLDGTALRSADLESGAYFVAGDAAPGHGRARRPFPPGYRYASHEIRGDEAEVVVSCAIDQGDGLVLRGMKVFRLRRRGAGWKVVPEPA